MIHRLETLIEESQVPSGGYWFKRGITVPSDNTAGYAKGCIYIDSDATDVQDAVYVNVGTFLLSNFDRVSVGMDIHNLTALGAAPAADDRVAVSDESTTSDPPRYVTVQELLNAVGSLDPFTGEIVEATDTILILDNGVAKEATVQVFLDGIHDLTALGAAVDVADLIPLTDEDQTGDPARTTTVQYLFDAAGNLTDLAAAPAIDDRVLVTDESVAGDPAKSMSMQNLFDGAQNLTAGAVASGSVFTMLNTNVAVVETIDDIATFMAGTVGNSGLAATSGVLAFTPASITAAVLADGDSIVFSDATSTGLPRLEAFADVATLLSGSGLTATSSVIALDVTNITTANTDPLNVADKVATSDASATHATKSITGQLFFNGMSTLTAGAVATGSVIPMLNSNVAVVETIDDIATFMAGTVGASGLAATSGVLAFTPASITAAVLADGDSIVFSDATDSLPKLEAFADVATLLAGDGLTATSSVIALDVNSLSTANTDPLNVLDKVSHSDTSASNATKTITGQLLFDGMSTLTAGAVATGSVIPMLNTNVAVVETIDDIATFLAGTVGASGLAATSGVLAFTPASITAAVMADGDSIVFSDATDTGLPKLEAFADVATLLAGIGLTATSSVINLTAAQHWAFHYGPGGEDTDGVFTNSGGMLGGSDTTDTEQGATYCATYDSGNTEFVALATSSSGTDVTNNYQFFSDSKSDNDAVYFGGATKFCEIGIDMSATIQDYTGDALTWEYADSATPTWATLTLQYDGTDATAQDGKRSFGRDGAISFIPPSGWTASQPNAVLAAGGYYIRARISTTANIGGNEGQTNSLEHHIITPNADAPTAPCAGTITDVRVSNIHDTVHDQNIEFLLYNATQHTWSGTTAHTWAGSQAIDTFGSLTLGVAADDILGIIVLDDNNSTNNPVWQVEYTVTPA